jgi:hypothetical protein
MCAPQIDNVHVPTPIIINGIPFDEDLLDPQDLIPDFDDFEDFDDNISDMYNLFISDSDSPIDYGQFQYPDFEESDDSSDEFSEINFDLQEMLSDFLLVDHVILRTYDETSALIYSRWIHENMADFPPELERFIAIQLGIIIDIAIQSAQPN